MWNWIMYSLFTTFSWLMSNKLVIGSIIYWEKYLRIKDHVQRIPRDKRGHLDPLCLTWSITNETIDLIKVLLHLPEFITVSFRVRLFIHLECPSDKHKHKYISTFKIVYNLFRFLFSFSEHNKEMYSKLYSKHRLELHSD